ncbi:MAG: hypothetical protein DRI91_03890, partial [Aquificota bacterium]
MKATPTKTGSHPSSSRYKEVKPWWFLLRREPRGKSNSPLIREIETMLSSAPILELQGVTIRFGGLTAVAQVDLTLYEGEILGLIGPNGAGKTTLFN